MKLQDIETVNLLSGKLKDVDKKLKEINSGKKPKYIRMYLDNSVDLMVKDCDHTKVLNIFKSYLTKERSEILEKLVSLGVKP